MNHNPIRKSARVLAGSVAAAMLATAVTTDSAKAASYGIDFIGYYGGPNSNVTTPLPTNDPFGPTGAVQSNWNQLNWGINVNNGGGSQNFTIRDQNIANPITLTVSMQNAGGNDGAGGGATNIAALYNTGLRDNDGTITLTTTVAPYLKYDLYKYFGNNSQGGNFILGTNYSVTSNLSGPLSFQIGALNGFSIVEVPQHRWVGGTVTLETDWGTGTNWASPVSVPTSGETIIFGTVDVVNPTADLGPSDRTLGGLAFHAATPMLIQSTQNDPGTMLPATLTLNGGAVTSISVEGNTHQVSAPLVLGSATTVAVSVPTASLTFSGPVSGAAITKTGAGTLVLSGANTYSGAGVNTVVSGGTLVAATPASLPGYAGGGEVTVASSATLVIRADGTAATWQSADVDALFTVSPFVAGSTLGVEVPTAATFTYNTGIGGAQGLSKLGAGTLGLGGTSGYSGATTVSAGTLQVTGTVNGSSSVTVAAAGSLTVNGDLTTPTLSTAGTTNLAAGSVGAITTMNVTGGSASVSGSTVTTLNTSAGSTTLGTAVTTLNVSGTGAVLGAAGAAATTVAVTGGTIDTQGNYLSVAGSMTMTGGNIVASGAAFGVKGSSITPNITSIGELKLDGGTVTVNTSGVVTLSQDFNIMGSGTTPPAGWSLLSAGGGSSTWGSSISLTGVSMSSTSGLTLLDNPSAANTNGYNALGVTGRAIATSPTSVAGSVIQSPQILNNTGGALTSFAIGYDIKRFSTGTETAPGYWLFYSLDGTNWTNASALNPTLTNVPNSVGTTNIATTTVTLSSSWNNGANLQLRWADDNSSTSSPDQTIGLDNVQLTAGSPAAVNLPTTDLVATSNTTLDLGFAGAATVRDVNLGSGIALTVQTATSLSMNALTGAAGSQLLASGMGLTIASGTHTGSITAASVTKTSTGVLRLDGTQTYDTLTVEDGTLNVNGTLGSGVAGVAVTDTAGGAPTTLRFGTVSQTLSSLTIGAGATVVFTSGTATGAFSGGGKALNFTGSAAVPEPGTLGLVLVGALGVLSRRRRGHPPRGCANRSSQPTGF